MQQDKTSSTLDTEQKIKEAARIIFHEKGFAATKTRDIAEAADINLALLNYYFRSKKKLFDIIMIETFQSFFSGVLVVLNNKETSIHEKVEIVVEYYIDLLSKNPNVAHFIINSVRENPNEFIEKVGIMHQIKASVFIHQIEEQRSQQNLRNIHPIHLLVNLLGMVVFPFIVKPIITNLAEIPEKEYMQLMQERKKLIPIWLKAIVEIN